MEQKKVRQSNFELLKIVAMFFIVFHHLVVKNAFNIDTEISGITANKLFLQLFGNLGFESVDLFFMVSAWFLCDTDGSFHLRKILSKVWNLEQRMLFYSIGIFAVFALCGCNGGWMLLFQSVFPLSTALWWYPTTYIVFLFLQPFLQKAFLGFEKRELATLTVVMLVLWSVTSCIPFFDYGFTNLIGFIMLYAVVFWVKKYGKEMMERKWILRVVFLSGMLLELLSIIVMDLIGTKIPLAAQYSCYFIRGNGRVLPMVFSVSFFLLCVTWNIRSRIINIAASSTFGIYLIHMYPLVKTYLFESLFNFKKYADTSYLALLALGEALLIFLMCMGIELARQCGACFITKTIKMVRGTPR